MGIPLTRPAPPRLSEAAALLKEIEDRGHFSNFGPVNTAFEADMIAQMFNGEGACLTVCNATLGLMLAVANVLRDQPGTRPARRMMSARSEAPRYALMPAFTFAAAAHAAMWCGLVPLFCDVDPRDWSASAAAEEAMLTRYGRQIAVVMPYATFGFDIDLARYEALSQRHDVPVVVDAAASLGTVQRDGRGFGSGFSGTIVYSMHATKSFATGEGGLIYSADRQMVADLRTMCNFGFGKARNATMLGINAKLSEVGALLGRLRLSDYDRVLNHRAELVARYRAALPELSFQPQRQNRQAHQFCSALLPNRLRRHRAAIQDAMAKDGIGTAAYFSPHLGQQDFFVEQAVFGALPVADNVASRVISLPLFDSMQAWEVDEVVASLCQALKAVRVRPLRPIQPIMQAGQTTPAAPVAAASLSRLPRQRGGGVTRVVVSAERSS